MCHDATMEQRHEVRDITVDRAHGVTVVFGDGVRADYDLLELRLNCPCAECRGLRDRDEAPWPQPASPLPLAITDASLHGAWGLGIEWNDGHATGIYPWEALRTWADEGKPSFTPDSGRGGV